MGETVVDVGNGWKHVTSVTEAEVWVSPPRWRKWLLWEKPRKERRSYISSAFVKQNGDALDVDQAQVVGQKVPLK